MPLNLMTVYNFCISYFNSACKLNRIQDITWHLFDLISVFISGNYCETLKFFLSESIRNASIHFENLYIIDTICF